MTAHVHPGQGAHRDAQLTHGDFLKGKSRHCIAFCAFSSHIS